MTIDYVGILYALSIVIGGLIGFIKAGSTASLISGVAFGSILGFGAYQTSQNPNNYYISLLTSLGLACTMGYRFIYHGYNFMPSGFVTAESLLMVYRYGARGLGLPTF